MTPGRSTSTITPSDPAGGAIRRLPYDRRGTLRKTGAVVRAPLWSFRRVRVRPARRHRLHRPPVGVAAASERAVSRRRATTRHRAINASDHRGAAATSAYARGTSYRPRDGTAGIVSRSVRSRRRRRRVADAVLLDGA
jgi:hypothetical protein